MRIIEMIYEVFLEGSLSIKPPETDQDLQELFEKLYRSDAKQAQEFQDFVFDIADKQGKYMFEAGFKLAVELILHASER